MPKKDKSALIRAVLKSHHDVLESLRPLLSLGGGHEIVKTFICCEFFAEILEF